MKRLSDIKQDNERIIKFATTQDCYNSYELLYDADLISDISRADIGDIIEYTLHRMKEEEFTDIEIKYNSNMYIPTDDEWLDLEEFEEFIHVDLGYILGGLILCAKEINE